MNYSEPRVLILSGLIRFVKDPPKNFQKIGKQNLCKEHDVAFQFAHRFHHAKC